MRKADSINEYVIILAIVGIVFVSMNTYLKRSIQAKVKDLTDATISMKMSEEERQLPQINKGSSHFERNNTSSLRIDEHQGGSFDYTENRTSFGSFEGRFFDPEKEIEVEGSSPGGEPITPPIYEE